MCWIDCEVCTFGPSIPGSSGSSGLLPVLMAICSAVISRVSSPARTLTRCGPTKEASPLMSVTASTVSSMARLAARSLATRLSREAMACRR